MQIFHHQFLGLFRKIVFFMMNDIFPDPAERRIPVQVFIDLLTLHFPQKGDQLPVEFRKGLCIDELGQVHLLGLADIAGLLFVAFAGHSVQRKTRKPFMVEQEDDPYPLEIADRLILFLD